jgi:hypothetical protein
MTMAMKTVERIVMVKEEPQENDKHHHHLILLFILLPLLVVSSGIVYGRRQQQQPGLRVLVKFVENGEETLDKWTDVDIYIQEHPQFERGTIPVRKRTRVRTRRIDSTCLVRSFAD